MAIPAQRPTNEIVDQFHRLYYDSPNTWQNTFWLGVPTQKCPLDLWIYQEIIFEVRPDVIIESGTYLGGSALFLASICDAVSKGKVITIDVEPMEGRPKHRRIMYMLGSSTSKDTVNAVQKVIGRRDTVMVILDSDHSKEHVLQELRAYGEMVSKGSYIIVEDTNINGHPVYPDFGPGPMEAVQEYLSENARFVLDESRSKFYMTFNPKGWLRRVG